MYEYVHSIPTIFTLIHKSQSVFIFIHSLEPHNMSGNDYYLTYHYYHHHLQINKSLKNEVICTKSNSKKNENALSHSKKKEFHLLSFYEALH